MSSSFNDRDYWSAYYAKRLGSIEHTTPSPFADYLVNEGLITDADLIELGCGNGRDSIFFAKSGAMVTAIDQCTNTTEILNRIHNIDSYSADFTQLPKRKSENLFNLIYSRFTMHSIDEEGENRTIKWAYENLEKGGSFCIEARTINDPMCGLGEDKGGNIWFHENHHRRFIDAEVFKLKLENAGFSISFFKEDSGFAKYKEEDPIVLRLIAKKD